MIVSGALRATTRSKGGVRARSAAASTVTDLSVFGGEITADSAAAHVDGGDRLDSVSAAASRERRS